MLPRSWPPQRGHPTGLFTQHPPWATSLHGVRRHHLSTVAKGNIRSIDQATQRLHIAEDPDVTRWFGTLARVIDDYDHTWSRTRKQRFSSWLGRVGRELALAVAANDGNGDPRQAITYLVCLSSS